MKMDGFEVFHIVSIFKVTYFQVSGKYKEKEQSSTGREFVREETDHAIQ